jgi:hypothetical protein
MKRILILAVLLLSILYSGDYLSVRYRIPRNRDPFGAVKIQRYYAVKQKDGKTEFIFDQPETQACVHSLFPHFGSRPCWYVNREKLKRIDI